MKSKAWRSVVGVAILVIAIGVGAVAQYRPYVLFKGTIGDYTPTTDTDGTKLGGPWVIRGDWSLTIDPDGKADFTAALTMVRSDEGAILAGSLDSPSARKAHTHHIKLVDGTLTTLSNGFEVNGVATLAGNGATPPNPPFTSGSSIPLKIDITGGDLVEFSNIQVFFEGDATKHFGSQAVHGVVNSFY